MERHDELRVAPAAQASVTRPLLLCRVVETWLAQPETSKRSGTTKVKMGRILDSRHTVSLEEVVLAQALQLEALLNVLERREVVWKAEVLAEIKRLREKSAKAR